MKKCVLGDVADVKVSGVDKKTNEGEISVRLCNYTDVYYNWAVTSEKYDGLMRASAKPDEISKFKIKKGQVALTKDSETRDDIGIPTYIADDFDDVLLGYHCALISPDAKELSGKYLNALLRTKYVKDFFANNAGGSGQRYYLSESSIKELPLFLPDITVQRKIGTFLSTIDRKIALNRKRIATLEAMAKEIYDYWFVQFDFPDAHGRPYKSSGGAMVYNPDLKREIPKGWEMKPLGDAVKELNSGEWGSDACGESSSVQVHCLRGADMEDQSHLPVRYISERKTDKLLRVGDIVIEMSGGSPTQATGRSCYVSQGLLDAYNGMLTCTNFCNSLKLKESDETSYFYFVWRMFYRAGLMFNFEGKTSGLKNLQIDSLLTTKWVFPPKELVTKFNKLFLSSTAQTDNCKKEISSLSDLRDFLLPLLMNGQVKVG